MKKHLAAALLIIGVLLSVISAGCAKSTDLLQKFPEYFDLDAFKGLEVYVWNTKDGYYCGVLTGTNRLKTLDELYGLMENGATIDEMKSILSTYNLSQESITVLPIEYFLQDQTREFRPEEVRELFFDK